MDQQNTRMLRLLPGLELLVKSLMGGVAENVLLLENISSSILVRPYRNFAEYTLLQLLSNWILPRMC